MEQTIAPTGTKKFGRLLFIASGGAGSAVIRHLAPEFAQSIGDPTMLRAEALYIDSNDSAKPAFLGMTGVETLILASQERRQSEGAGRDRAAIVDTVRKNVPAIMSKIKPDDFVVIFASTAGGTGSTVMQLVTQAMTASGIVCLMIPATGDQSVDAARNTYDTLAGIRAWIFKNSPGQAIPMMSIENTSYELTASTVGSIVADFRALLADSVAGFDTSDMKRFFNHASRGRGQADLNIVSINRESEFTSPGENHQFYAICRLAHTPAPGPVLHGVERIVDFDALCVHDGESTIYASSPLLVDDFIGELLNVKTSAEDRAKNLFEKMQSRTHSVAAATAMNPVDDDGFMP